MNERLHAASNLVIRERTLDGEERLLLRRIFFVGLTLRILVALVIALFDLEDFFGGDAATYHLIGASIARYWRGESAFAVWPASQPGYFYFVAAIYYVLGPVPLLVVMINCFVGAFHALLVYRIALLVFDRPVARMAAWLTACFPSLVLWSAQLLKDPLVILCILLCIYAVLQLHHRFSLIYVLLFFAALLPLHPLRNYVFYIVAVSAVISFIGSKRGPIVGLTTQSLIVFLLTLIINSVGVLDRELESLTVDHVLQQIHLSRIKLATFAQSGFAREADVSTVGGALRFLPIGFLYLMLAPFPWAITSLRSAITMPEMVVWWALIPSLVRGLLLAVRRKIAESAVILLFTGGLTIIYSLFQGNVGTAYRQRAQIIVFFFIFISAGWLDRRRKRMRQPPESNPPRRPQSAEPV
ncbi:MAG TPA: glycosyltransferase family 39 protein [Blastocatellia bacterium]|nr:glycosyltransferase family 39 protein [Blastocatellia bacterium]